ncbi:unnamed protein product [Cercopithifilaria johnstoni]|uniref:Uncharacterized protein n=1 Tax=Cercopithifilaria johnstoni TaxID=2874296 RepID=A0A8J2LVE5_9BILA|nr:unnamed protein product [Cercopithifilaria johnstoni]
MARLTQSYENRVKAPDRLDRSVKCPKLYGIVELEIEVTELLENISIALHYLQKLDLFSATNNELQIFQKDISALIDAVTNLKHKIQKTFKDVTFQEDIQGFTSSRDNILVPTSREMTDKTWRNIQEIKEVDDKQSDPVAFNRRFAAGSSTIASERQNLPQITKKERKKNKIEGKQTNLKRTDPNIFEEIIQNSEYKIIQNRNSQ